MVMWPILFLISVETFYVLCDTNINEGIDLQYDLEQLLYNQTLENCNNDTIISYLDHNLCSDFYYMYETCNFFNMTNEEVRRCSIKFLFPKPYEWALIAMHAATFVVGLVGNALVCVAVYKNHAMRNVTNYFIVNLAVADFMVILFCLPPSVVWDVTETWFFGNALCKIILYIQTVSVSVSVLTLTFISVDRWYAICFPLRFISTTSRAKISIVIIWIISFIIDIPELIVLQAVRDPPSRRTGLPSIVYTQCTPQWQYEVVNQTSRIVLLYTVPLFFMSVAYFQIVRVLWTSDNIPNNYSGIYQKNSLHNNRRIPLGNTTESQIRSRRKAAKMLVAVVTMFAICYLPVHVMNILRLLTKIEHTNYTEALSNFTHWLCYANSAINPVIYNFMSGNFRREFKRAFQHCHKCGKNDSRSDVGLVSQNDFVHSFNRRTSQSLAISSRRTRTTSFIT